MGNLKKESLLYGVIGLLLGVVLAGGAAIFAVNNDSYSMMRMMGMDTRHLDSKISSDHSQMSMTEMTEQLKNKSGDEFDKAFIEMMIVHHEGAVEMAALIPSRAKHSEIKSLGEAIISAQTKEIADMKQWQHDWGYSTDKPVHKMQGGH